MSDYHKDLKCEKCGSANLRAIAPLRLHFQTHVHCDDCEHDELEILAFMRWDIARHTSADQTCIAEQDDPAT